MNSQNERNQRPVCHPASDLPPDMRWLTAADLGVILGLKLQTIYNRLCSNPETLPPTTRIPGFRGPRWSARVVREWQAKFDPRDAGEPALPRRRGRPSKAEAIARRNQGMGCRP